MGSVPSGFEAVDDAIRAGADGAFSFLERLIGARSTVGEEAPAQRIVAEELARLGFDVAAVPVPPGTVAQPGAGVAQAPYPGRANVWGRMGEGGSPSLLLNGHVDVVPAEPAVWRDRDRGRPRARRGGRPRRQSGAVPASDPPGTGRPRGGDQHRRRRPGLP